MIKQGLVCTLYRSKLISSLTFSQLYFLKRELKGCRSVLDLGSGTESPLRHCKVPFSVAVDLFKDAVIESKARGTHSAYVVADLKTLEFKERSFDAVALCEVIEHLDKEDGWRLLEKAESWAKKKVIVSTPNGWLPQPPVCGNPYQVHRSAWYIEEMTKRGYKVYGMVGLRWKPSRFLFVPLFLWGVVSVFFQWVTYAHPKIAYEICYVKDRSPGS